LKSIDINFTENVEYRAKRAITLVVVFCAIALMFGKKKLIYSCLKIDLKFIFMQMYVEGNEKKC
jgi:hypothetical protein